MDLSTIKPVERAYEVTHPYTGKPTGLVLTLACTHDERVKTAIRAANDHYLKTAGDKPSQKDLDDYDHSLMAAHITKIEFTGDANWKGKTPAYSNDLARELCEVHVIKEQVVKEVKKVKDFYKA
jgi:hypothetical protein